MKTTEFLDYFPELKGMPKQEQVATLESARYEAFVRQGLAGKSVFLMVSALVAAALIAFIPSVLGVNSIILNSLFVGAGVFVALCLYKVFYARLLRHGLLRVLSKQRLYDTHRSAQ